MQDKIIEIAGVKITSDLSIQTYHQLINPLVTIKKENSQIHGLTNKILKDSPTLKKPLRSFWDFVGKTPLMAHNATFDISFMAKANFDYQYPHHGLTKVYDSCKFARSALKKIENPPENYKLSTLASFLNFSLEHHVALEDSFASLKIFAHLLENHPGDFHKSYLLTLKQYKDNKSFQLPKKFNDLMDFIELKKDFEIQYKGGTQGTIWRRVSPIGLIPMPNGIMLYGHCHLDDKPKSFAVKKIKNYRGVG